MAPCCSWIPAFAGMTGEVFGLVDEVLTHHFPVVGYTASTWGAAGRGADSATRT
jgi:hypothetical protein